MHLLIANNSASALVSFDSDYELISTTVLGSDTASVTFSSLGTYSSDYKHLQIRGTARSDRATYTVESIKMQINSTNMTKYHRLYGNGTSVASNIDTTIAEVSTNVAVSNSFGAMIIDILDVYSTSKNKTVKALSGTYSADAGGFSGKTVQLASSFLDSTSAISSINIAPTFGSNFVAGSRFSLYGIR